MKSGIALAQLALDQIVSQFEAQTSVIARLLDATIAAGKARDSMRMTGTAVADAAGNADFTFRVPAGAGYSLVSLAGAGSNVTTGYGALYLNEISGRTIMRAFSAGLVFSDDFQSKEYVPANTVLMVRLSGMTPGDTCNFSLKVELEDN